MPTPTCSCASLCLDDNGHPSILPLTLYMTIAGLATLTHLLTMAFKLALFLLASLLVLTSEVSSDLEYSKDAAAYGKVKPPPAAPAPAPAPAQPAPRVIKDIKECDDACKGRCKLHSRPNLCTRACNTCCRECKCVPPGTYGYRELCGTCYTEWKTHGNRTKCP